MAYRKQETEIENLAFYTYGRLEQDITYIAKQHGVSESELTRGILTLFSSKTGGPVLGIEHHMPVLQAETRNGHLLAPAVALVERTHDIMQGQGDPRPLNRRGKPRGKRDGQARLKALAIIEKMELPMETRPFHDTLRQEIGKSIKATGSLVDRLVREKILNRKHRIISLGKNAPGASQQPAEVIVPPAKPQKLKASEFILPFVDQLKGQPIHGTELCHRLRALYPNFSPNAWSPGINALVTTRKLNRSKDNMITLGSGFRSHAG